MNFIAPARDLDYWKNWVLEINSESPVRVPIGETKSFKQMDVSRIQEFVPQSIPVATVFPRMATVILEPEPTTTVLTDAHSDSAAVESTLLLEPETTNEAAVTEEKRAEHTEKSTDETPVVLLESTVIQEPAVTSETMDEELDPEVTVMATVVSEEPVESDDEVESEDVEQKPKQPKNKKLKRRGTNKKGV